MSQGQIHALENISFYIKFSKNLKENENILTLSLNY